MNQTFVERYENASSLIVLSYIRGLSDWEPYHSDGYDWEPEDSDSYGWGSWYDPHIRDLVLGQLQEAALAGELIGVLHLFELSYCSELCP